MTAVARARSASLDTRQKVHIGSTRREASIQAAAEASGPPSRDASAQPGRACSWCRARIPATRRRDARHCSTRCRQAAHRAAIRRSELEATDRPLALAYADPPYPGNARRYYARHPDFAGEVDHGELLSRLAGYDGWALSTSARALPAVLALAVARGLAVRVAAWPRRPAPHPSARVLNAWEAVVYVPARGSPRPPGAQVVLDVLQGVAARRRPTLPTAVIGMKPPAFCEWVFRLLGASPGDRLDDLYPGSGIVERTWQIYASLPAERDASPPGPRNASSEVLHDASRGSAR